MRPNYNLFHVRIYVLCVGLGIGVGVAILVGGDERFAGPSFVGPTALVSWTPIPPYMIWGAAFLGYGLALVGALGRSIAIHALRVGIALYLFLAVSFFGSVLADNQASITGLVAYTIFALIHLYLQDHLTHRGWER